MKEIEYKQITKQSSCNHITLDELNKLGKEGWELVMHNSYGDSNMYTFKRVQNGN